MSKTLKAPEGYKSRLYVIYHVPISSGKVTLFR